MIEVTDQLGKDILINSSPKRIISLVPSQTELLFYLGLENQVSGVTKFCVHPNMAVKKKAVVGGTKKFRFEVIEKLKPDLIIGNKEENYKEGIDILEKNYPVWMSNVVTFEDAYEMILSIGTITATEESARNLVSGIKSGYKSLDKRKGKNRVLYLIWQDPMMLAGNDTFIDTVIENLGFDNLASELQGRYPEATVEILRELNPDIIFLSSEPFPFKDEHKRNFQKLFPDSQIKLVDGEMFSWYGNRLLYAKDYFEELLQRLN